MQKASRLRLRPWLEEQIQSGKYPGVSWLDQSSRVFQIPWKHAARHGWSIDRDATLFRSWAMHTGRYHPGRDQPDPKTWKANFRCALNSLPDICELRDQSRKKGSDAYRVYRMLPSTRTHRRRRGLQVSNRPRERRMSLAEAGIHDTHTSHTSNTKYITHSSHNSNATHATLCDGGQCVKEENQAEDPYGHTQTYGLWEAKPDEQEQTEAVFKLEDQLSSAELWGQSGEPRTWRTHTLWDHWHCADEDFLCFPPTYTHCTTNSDSTGQYYRKDLSDWSTLQPTPTP